MQPVFSESLDEHVAGRKPCELSPGLGVDLTHEKRGVLAREEVEPDTLALGQQLSDLGIIPFAAALLLGAAGVTVVEPALPVALAEGASQGLLV